MQNNFNKNAVPFERGNTEQEDVSVPPIRYGIIIKSELI